MHLYTCTDTEPRADLVMGSLAHAVVVAGGWCRISTNYATPSHMLDRLVNYKQALMDEQRNVSAAGPEAHAPVVWRCACSVGMRL